MADIHKLIVLQVQMDFTSSNRGRLQELKQGFAIPWENYKKGNVRPMHFGADNGTSDLFGDELIDMCLCPSLRDDPKTDLKICAYCKIKYKIPIPCYVEVKTIAYPKLSKDQINFMNAQKARGARCYVAMENEDKSEKIYTLREWEIE